MKFAEINVGQTFITSLLPEDIAEKCGIVCIEKHENPNKVIVKRMNADEQWPIFTDKTGDEVIMGNWIIKPEDKEIVKEDIDYTLYNADPNCKHQIIQKWSGVECEKCGGWFCF